VTSVFSLSSATENTEKKIFAAQQGPGNWRYRDHREKHFGSLACGLRITVPCLFTPSF
jgi:hypothetical protein